jgi:nitrous oxidase accessory protein
VTVVLPRRAERWFAVATAVLLVASVGAAVAAPAPAGDTGDGVQFDAPVPDELDFDAPPADGHATVDGERYGNLAAALDAADDGDTVRVAGTVDGPVTVDTPNVTLTGAAPSEAVLAGDGEGDVLTVDAPGVTVRDLWVRNSGYSTADNDAAIWVNASDVAVVDARVTDATFGIWLNGVADARVADTTIVGREDVTPRSARGNGIQLWEADDATLVDNRVTDARDGIYFSWSTGVEARGNALWDLRYGVHYMYSDDCRLAANTAFGNDAGYALMVSDRLTVVNNTAVNNTGSSGHGVLVKSVDHTTIRGNDLVGNDNGVFVYNSLDNTIADNLVAGNDVGVHLTAGSVEERGYGNTFVRNGDAMKAVVGEQVAWNGSEDGNYWADARPVDVDHDGVSEVRFRATGALDRLADRAPAVEVFASSPALDAVRLATRSVPVLEQPGVVDHHPLATPPHDDWRRYYE